MRSWTKVRRLVDHVEEPNHVRRARRIAPDHRRGRGADVARLASRLRVFIEVVRRACGVTDGRVVVQRLAHPSRKIRARAEVLRLLRIGRQIVGFERSAWMPLNWSRDRHRLRLPAVFEERLHRLAEDHFLFGASQAERRVDAGPVQHRVEDPPCADQHRSSGVTPGPSHDERHVHGRLVEEVPVLHLAVIAEAFAVIGATTIALGPARSTRTPAPGVPVAGPWLRLRRDMAWTRGCGTAPAACMARADRSSAPT